jgi:hypothetical protein
MFDDDGLILSDDGHALVRGSLGSAPAEPFVVIVLFGSERERDD